MLIDSNIIIYALNNDSPKQNRAQNFLLNEKKTIFAQQNIFESLRILTHRQFPNPFPTTDAISAITAITQTGLIIYPTFETQALTLALIEKYHITGTEVFDAYLVATCLSNGVKKIATDNTRHLAKYEEMNVINPFEHQSSAEQR